MEGAVAQAIAAVVGGWSVRGSGRAAVEREKGGDGGSEEASASLEATTSTSLEATRPASLEAATALPSCGDGRLISCEEARLKPQPVWSTVAVATDKIVIRPGESKVVELVAVESRGKWQHRNARFRKAALAMPAQARVVFDANRRATEAERTMTRGAPGREMLESERTRWKNIDVAGGGYFSRQDEHGKEVVEEQAALCCFLERDEPLYTVVTNRSQEVFEVSRLEPFGSLEYFEDYSDRAAVESAACEALRATASKVQDWSQTEDGRAKLAEAFGVDASEGGDAPTRSKKRAKTTSTSEELTKLLAEFRKREAAGESASTLEPLLNRCWRLGKDSGDVEPDKDGEIASVSLMREVPDDVEPVHTTFVMDKMKEEQKREDDASHEFWCEIDERLRSKVQQETVFPEMWRSANVDGIEAAAAKRSQAQVDQIFASVLNIQGAVEEEIEVASQQDNPAGLQPGEEEAFEKMFEETLGKAVMSVDQRKVAEDLLKEFYDVFRESGTFLPVRGFEVPLEVVDPTAKPVWQKPRKLPPQFEAQGVEHFRTLLQHGILERVSSPWNSNIVVAPKKDPKTQQYTLARFAVNYVQVNKALKPMYHVFDKIDDALHDLGGQPGEGGGEFWASSFDFSQFFHQLRMSPLARQFTSFYCPGIGQLAWVGMPYGLQAAPWACAMATDKIFEGMKGKNLRVIVDDCLVCTRGSFEEHMKTLRQFFERCRLWRVTVKGSKSSICAPELIYCGTKVCRDGTLHKEETKVDAVKNWPVPKNSGEVRIFHGLGSYFRSYVKNFAIIAKPLSSVMADESQFKWGPEQQGSFDTLKAALAVDVPLAQPDYSKPFTVATDWSQGGVGAVLSQKDDKGQDRPIVFVSRVLTGSERNLGASQGELLAILFALEKLRGFLWGRRFRLECDHQALLTILENDGNQSAKLARWAQRLAAWDFEVVFRRGVDNGAADAMSRRPVEGAQAMELDVAVDENDVFGDIVHGLKLR